MRRRLIVTACLACTLVIVSAALYKRWISPRDKPSLEENDVPSLQATLTVPPFSTKEPEAYTATRIVTQTESTTSASGPESAGTTLRVLIARDGDKRREEFVNDDGESVVYLDIPSGQFVLLPSSQMFADLNQESANAARKNAANSSSELSPDLLLNQEHSGSTYEKIGTEPVDGRPTVKYRVTTANPGPTGVKTETMIWIDESLGMPIKSETTSSFGERSSISRVEVKDIKLSVEERLFDLPANYRKVEVAVILDKIRTNKPGP